MIAEYLTLSLHASTTEAKLHKEKSRRQQLEMLISQLHLDLLMRAEPNSEGEEVVNVSGFLWEQVCEVVKEGEE